VPGQIVRLFVPLDDPRLPFVLIGVFHLLRWLCGALFIAAVYGFVARFLRRPADRVLALVLVTLGGGLGWLLMVTRNSEWLGSLPVDLFVPEAFPFHMLYGLPHLALAGAGMLGGMAMLLGSGEQSKDVMQSGKGAKQQSRDFTAEGVGATWQVAPTGRWSLITLCWLITGLSVPFYLAVIYVVLAAWGLAAWISQRRFPMVLLRRALLPALLTLPLFGYYALAFQGNPALAQWSAQNLLPSPHPLHYLLAFSLILIPAAWGARRAWNRARLDFRQALLLAWPVIVPLLVYLPINVQRRLAALVIVPLAILAVMGLRWLIHQRPRLRFARPLLLTAMLATSAFLIFTGCLNALNLMVPIFREAAELRALQWLDQQAPVDSVVLAAFETGNVIPAYTDLRPFVGHGPESLFALTKTDQTEAFFGGQMGEAERLALYRDFSIRYLFYGPLERKLAEAAGLDPTAPPWAVDGDLIYEADGYQVYQLTAY